jgi:hypothetical protein
MSNLSDRVLLSGRAISVGKSIDTDTTNLSPLSYEGAIVKGPDKLMHYSVGDRWIALAPVQSTLFDAGNAATVYEGGASIDLGSAQS